MGVDCFAPISCLHQYSLTQAPKGIQSVSILRRCLSVLYMVPMLKKFQYAACQDTLRKTRELRAFTPPLEERGARLVCICKGQVGFCIKGKKGLALYTFPSFWGGRWGEKYQGRSSGTQLYKRVPYWHKDTLLPHLSECFIRHWALQAGGFENTPSRRRKPRKEAKGL